MRTIVGLSDLILAGAMYFLFLQMQKQAPVRGFGYPLPGTLGIALVAAGILLFRTLLEVLSTRALVAFGQSFYSDILCRLIRGYGEIQWVRYIERNRGELLSHTTQTGRDAAGFYTALIEWVASIAVVVGTAVVVICRSPGAAICIACFVAIFYGVHRGLLRKKLRLAADLRERSVRRLNKMLADMLAIGKEIRTYANPSSFYNRLEQQAHEAAVSHRQTVYLPQLSRIFSDQGVLFLFLTLIIVVQLQHGDAGKLLPILVFYFVLSRRLLPLISQISFLAGSLESSFASVSVVANELEWCALFRAPVDIVLKPGPGFVLEMTNVNFAFDLDRPILRKVSFQMQTGERVVLLGASGGGKTSLLQLVAGILQAQEGAIFVDRSSLAYVPQETVLLDDSIRNNLLFGTAATSDAELLQALHMSNMREFVMTLPAGLETLVGDNGVLLSGGQRQRLGLARALLGRPTLLLLDEATSALDLDSERQILENLSRLGQSVFFVTHRVHASSFAHRTLRLKVGKLVEDQTVHLTSQRLAIDFVN